MANQNANIYIKLEGVDKFITDSNSLVQGLNKTDKAVKQTTEATEDLSKTTKKSSEGLGQLGGLAGSLPGPLGAMGGAIGQVSKATSLFDKVLKVLAVNPIIIPITAIVVALTTLYKAFTSTKEGSEVVDQALAGLSAVFDVLRDRVLQIGGAIVKFLSGDFGGAASDLKDAFSGVGDEIVDEFNKAKEATALLQDLDDAQRSLNERRSEQNKLLAQARLDAKDENLSLEERREALQKVIDAEQALADDELALQRQRVDALQVLADLSDSDAETLEELSQEKQKLNNLETASINQRRNAQLELNKLDREAERIAENARKKREKDEQDRIKKAEAVAGILEKIRLDAITDEEEKAIKSVEIERDKQLKKLKENNATAEQIAEVELYWEGVIDTTRQMFADRETLRQQNRLQENLNLYEQIYLDTLSDLDRQETLLMQAADAQIAILDRLLEDKIISEEEYVKKVLAINTKLQEDIQALNKDTQEKKEEGERASDLEIAQASLRSAQLLNSALKNLSDVKTQEQLKNVEKGSKQEEEILKKQFERNKKFQIAQATIAIAQSILTALSTAPPPASFILAGANAAAGAIQIAAIKKTTFSGGGSTPSSGGGGVGGSINYQLGGQQVGQTITTGQTSTGESISQEPLRAYVIATDVSNAQEANSQIENLARL